MLLGEKELAVISKSYSVDRGKRILLELNFIADADEEVNSEYFIDFCRDKMVESHKTELEGLGFGVLQPG